MNEIEQAAKELAEAEADLLWRTDKYYDATEAIEALALARLRYDRLVRDEGQQQHDADAIATAITELLFTDGAGNRLVMEVSSTQLGLGWSKRSAQKRIKELLDQLFRPTGKEDEGR